MKNRTSIPDRLKCSKHTPYKKGLEGRWYHPDAVLTKFGEYHDWYKCPLCGLEFRIELPE